MRLLDLLLKFDWDSVWSTGILVDQYGESEAERARYSEIYIELRNLEPKSTEITIVLTLETDAAGDSGIRVSGICTEAGADSPERYGIGMEDWSEWIAMPVATRTLQEFTGPEIIAHCLYEMTFYGWYRGENLAQADQISRLVSFTRRSSSMQYHAFLCHASEDKDIATQIFDYLEREGYRIWFDELDIALGDSLRSEIDKGLAEAWYGIVILSPAFFKKHWTQYELDGLVARQMEGDKVILPIWHNVTKRDVLRYSPALAGMKAISTEEHPRKVAFRIGEILNLVVRI